MREGVFTQSYKGMGTPCREPVVHACSDLDVSTKPDPLLLVRD